MRILNTRPFPKNQELTQLLTLQGFDVESYPAVLIEKPEQLQNDQFARNLALNLDQFSDIIVTSTFAADFGLDFLESYWPQWPLVNWWAIGNSTAKAMSQFHIQAIHIPEANSEALLHALQQHWNSDEGYNPNLPRKVLIIAGANGRGLLQSSLQKSDISSKTLICYRRIPNTTAFEPKPMNAVILTSIQSADIILKDLKTTQKFGLDCFFVCASQRIAEFVESKGAVKVINSRSASNKILSETLKRLLC